MASAAALAVEGVRMLQDTGGIASAVLSGVWRSRALIFVIWVTPGPVRPGRLVRWRRSTLIPFRRAPCALLARPLRWLPSGLHSSGLSKILSRVFADALASGEMDFLQEKTRTLPWSIACGQLCAFAVPTFSFRRRRNGGDIVISAELNTFLLLATQREDADSLFFQSPAADRRRHRDWFAPEELHRCAGRTTRSEGIARSTRSHDGPDWALLWRRDDLRSASPGQSRDSAPVAVARTGRHVADQFAVGIDDCAALVQHIIEHLHDFRVCCHCGLMRNRSTPSACTSSSSYSRL